MANLSRLPMPTQDQYEWQYDGACNDADPETFFSPEFERGDRRDARESAAKAFCARCPVVRECLEHALAAEEPFGVWGAKNTRERMAMLGRHRAPDGTLVRPA
ncbi:WhiB family transcriptional regulator [Solicola sp. PLA-1-18]|uniref:WhiB family transcriptional regulator n=1 Tax=Solicola sp. PLA-1-18 TaxID=3380532 RepID=UPI003B82A5C6